jgi:hypothetical protein
MWRDHQALRAYAQFDHVSQPALFYEGLGNPDAARIADANEFLAHTTHPVVITL